VFFLSDKSPFADKASVDNNAKVDVSFTELVCILINLVFIRMCVRKS
ncbi:MAG: hypothetical protein ACJA2E_002474, partial [Arenicella sp.]